MADDTVSPDDSAETPPTDGTPDGDLSDNSTAAPAPAEQSGIWSSLDKLAQSSIASVGGSLATAASVNITRSTNTAPAPDLTAKAAIPNAIKSVASVAGVSLPILVIGVAAIWLLMSSRKAA